jgi:hypothetical protein
MDNAETSGEGDSGFHSSEYQVTGQPSPTVSPQEINDINRAIALSLEEYDDRYVLLPGVGAQMAMADADKDIDRPTTPKRFEFEDDHGPSSLTPTHQEHAFEARPSNPNTPYPKSKPDGFNLLLNSTQTVGDRIKFLDMKLAQDIFLLHDADADTLVFIDPPPQQPEQNYIQYKEYREHCLKPHRVHSSKFLALGSSVFNNAFGPTKQYRVLGKRGLRGHLPPGIKYVLDLSPPTEGEDAAYLMTELSCAMGVRMWFQAETQWDVSKALVGGQEVFEYSQAPKTTPEPIPWVPGEPPKPPKEETGPEPMLKKKEKEKKKMNWAGELPKPPPTVEDEFTSAPSPTAPEASPLLQQAPTIPFKPSIPLDYSPIRHRSAIERVLHALCGLDPKLDSAPKIWTFFAVAKYLDCAKHPAIGDWVIRWMYAAPNSYFIELHPDIACRVADGVQCLALSRDAYSILVGEEALDNLRRTRDPNYKSRHQNSYGRMKEELTEEDQTRVEYGSKSFLERINKVFLLLVDEDMMWLHDLPEFRIVQNFQSESGIDMEVRERLIKTLKQYVRGRLFATLCRDQEGVPFHLKESLGWKNRYPYPSYQDVYNSLEIRERIFTRTAWQILKGVDVSRGDSNFSLYNSGPLRMGYSLEALMAKENTNLKRIERTALATLAYTFEQTQVAIKRAAEEQARLDSLAAVPQTTASNSFMFSKLSPSEYGGSQYAMVSRSVLPERTRVTMDDVLNLDKFENLTVRSPPRLAENAEGTKSRDKRRKLSVTEDVFVEADQSEDSTSAAPSLTKTASTNDQKSPGKGLPLRPLSNRFPSTASSYMEPVGSSTASSYVESVDEDGVWGVIHPSLLNQGGTLVRESVGSASANASASASADPSSKLNVPGKRSACPRALLNSTLGLVTIGQADQTRHGYPAVFSLSHFFAEVNAHVRKVCQKMLATANHELGPDALVPNLTDTLVCLDDNEWKYLPLWAGGCDDGSGGVFIDGVPSIETGGFSAPGPNVHTGSAATSESSFEMVDSKTEVTNSRHTSTVAQDGFSDNLDRTRVYEADSLWDEVMANTEAKWANAVADKGKGKGKASHVDENEDTQTMIAASVDDSSIKAGAMDDDANWEVGDADGFGSDIEDGDDDAAEGEEDSDDDEDSNHIVEDVDCEDFEII